MIALRRRGQEHIVFRDGADARVQHAYPHLFGRELLQRVGQHFRRTADVGFDDQVEIFEIAFFELLAPANRASRRERLSPSRLRALLTRGK